MDSPASNSSGHECVIKIAVNAVTDILTNEQRDAFLVVNIVSICSFIAVFGVVTNLINMVIFYIQGFSNTVNISFFGLAISDLCCLLTMLWMSVCLNPLVAKSNIPWVLLELMYLPGAWPTITCGRITSYITVYVTAERCICIIMPLKVKDIVTPCRTLISIFLIYFLNILTLIPEYATSYYHWKLFPDRNLTLLALTYTENRPQVVGVVFFLSFVTGVASFVAVVVFTSILTVKLRQSSKWRQEMTSNPGSQSGSMTNRDRKTLKMIILIASVLVICYSPGAAISVTTFIVPEFDLQKGYANIGLAMWSVACVFQATNSSVNIFLYYKMSSKYRETFRFVSNYCLHGAGRKFDKSI